MADKPLHIQLEVGGVQLIDVRSVKGREAMSYGYRLEIAAFLHEVQPIDPDAIIKTEAALHLNREGLRRRIDGVVSEAIVMRSVSGRPELRMVLESKWMLTRYRTDIRLFRDKTVPEMVAEVLSETGVKFEQRLTGDYPVRPYTVQHRESDYHFVSRLLEEEGIFYFIADGDVMVMGDHTGAYDSAGSYPFLQPDGMDRNDESIWELGDLSEAGVSKVSLRDWSIDRPSLDLDVEATGPTASGAEWYDYPGEYDEPAAGQRIANLMAEAYACQADQVAGRSSAAAFAPGRTFTVTGSPMGEMDGAYVLTAVAHDYRRTEEGWSVTFEGNDADVVYRPERRHEEPILAGPVTGFVVGPPGEDIHCDELGRIKVQYHWDRLFPKDDTCSHWVPVVQDNTGHSVQIPRIGWEVLVHFLEGDPDRPVVLGRVYNAWDPFEIDLPTNKMWTSLRSRSSPTRDGSNEIQFNDAAGRQRISFFAEKDQNVVIANDKSEHVMSNETRNIEHDENISVGNDQIIDIGGDIIPTVTNDQTVSIGGNSERHIGKADGITVGNNMDLTIGGDHKRRVATSDSAEATNLTETIGAMILEASIKGNNFVASKAMAVLVGGAMLEIAKEVKNESASKLRTELIGGVLFSKAGNEHKTTARANRFTTVGGLKLIDAKEEMSINGADTLTMQGMIHKHATDASITFEVGSTSMTMKDGVIHLATPKISFSISGSNQQGAKESYQN
jgi:type VI secretion system secreted protein VgrG